MRNLGAGLFILTLVGLAYGLLLTGQARAQNRGVYPLGMSATNSGVTLNRFHLREPTPHLLPR
jgi:hypothetical protein